MKHAYAVSETSRQTISAALKALMAQKPLDQITIAEIMGLAGMRRQHFYYYFEDIYDLVQWMFEKEAMSLLRQQEGAQLWQHGLLQLFAYLEENRALCLNALTSTGSRPVKAFLQRELYAILHRTVEQLAPDTNPDGSLLDKVLLTRFYVMALAGLIESWLLGELDRTPEEVIQFTDAMLQNQMRGAACSPADPGKEN